MTPRRAPRASGRRRWLPVAAFVLVILALVALAITPALMVRRMVTVFEVNRTTFQPARRLVSDLRFSLEHQVAEMRGLVLTEESRYLDGYLEALRTETEILERLSPLVQEIGPVAAALLEEVREVSARWHILDNALARGEITHEEYGEFLPRQAALYDSTFTATALLEREIDRIAVVRGREVGEAVRRQSTVSLIFGLLALLSAVVVGWFGWRQYTLTLELERAIGEEARLREESEDRRKELESITASRRRLIRGFTHDVKNPLSAADGFLQLLEEGVMDGLTEAQKGSVAKSRQAIGGALELIDDLLDLARAETEAVTIEWAPTDLRTVVREATEEYRAQAEAKGLFMRTVIPDELPSITSDAARIRQILGNLISNAVKYTRQGGITIGATIRAGGSALGPGQWAAVEVSDTGPGIPESQQQLLFQEFSRLATSAGEKGTGVGLAISQLLARALGGEITVESKVGKGSVFTLWLPLETGGAG